MRKAKHTKTPWDTDDPHIVCAQIGGDLVYLANTNDLDTEYPVSAANAAFIVRAANAHDGLVAALKRIASMDVDRFNSEEPRNVALSALAMLDPPPPARPANNPTQS